VEDGSGARRPGLLVAAWVAVAILFGIGLITGSAWPWVASLVVATPLAIVGVLQWIAGR
jgi:hypothetical protein